jgi:hypothetical protein
MNCKNCDQVLQGKFCAHCGQSASVDKVNFANFVSELSRSIFQIDRGLFYTMKALFVSPGSSIKAYLGGRRKYHFKPIAYVFALSTIYFLLAKWVDNNTFVNDFIQGYSGHHEESGEVLNQSAVLNWFAQNFAYTALMLLPIFTFASWIAFLGTGYNYLEHFVLNAYISGQQALFYAITSLISRVVGDDSFLSSATLFISVVYLFIVYWQFFSETGRVAIVFRSILTYGLYLFLLSLFSAVFFL